MTHDTCRRKTKHCRSACTWTRSYCSIANVGHVTWSDVSY